MMKEEDTKKEWILLVLLTVLAAALAVAAEGVWVREVRRVEEERR